MKVLNLNKKQHRNQNQITEHPLYSKRLRISYQEKGSKRSGSVHTLLRTWGTQIFRTKIYKKKKERKKNEKYG